MNYCFLVSWSILQALLGWMNDAMNNAFKNPSFLIFDFEYWNTYHNIYFGDLLKVSIASGRLLHSTCQLHNLDHICTPTCFRKSWLICGRMTIEAKGWNTGHTDGSIEQICNLLIAKIFYYMVTMPISQSLDLHSMWERKNWNSILWSWWSLSKHNKLYTSLTSVSITSN